MPDTQPISIGSRPDGSPVSYQPREDGNLLIAGAPGSGKTEALRTIVSEALANGAEAYIFELAQGGPALGITLSTATRFATELDAAADLMTALELEVRRRRELVLAHRVASTRDLADDVRPPHLFAVLDESSDLLGEPPFTMNDKIMHDHIMETLTSLLTMGRSAGVTILMSTHTITGLRNSHALLQDFGTRLLLGCSSPTERELVLGSVDAPPVDGGPGYGLYQRAGNHTFANVYCRKLHETLQGAGA